jgi:hypothetical protein
VAAWAAVGSSPLSGFTGPVRLESSPALTPAALAATESPAGLHAIRARIDHVDRNCQFRTPCVFVRIRIALRQRAAVHAAVFRGATVVDRGGRTLGRGVHTIVVRAVVRRGPLAGLYHVLLAADGEPPVASNVLRVS